MIAMPSSHQPEDALSLLVSIMSVCSLDKRLRTSDVWTEGRKAATLLFLTIGVAFDYAPIWEKGLANDFPGKPALLSVAGFCYL